MDTNDEALGVCKVATVLEIVDELTVAVFTCEVSMCVPLLVYDSKLGDVLLMAC